ncbi:MAG: efflux RND transporter periplasmic adaptor subunit [Gammaproteobacteria bacterium]|nr:efflux RND transporter periplasmic adaptor subunit [Gammaproteobacteria bacterium]
MDKTIIRKRMKVMLICVSILFGGILIYKFIGVQLIKHYIATYSRVVGVSTMEVHYAPWQPKHIASGSLRAIRGVNVTTEMAGLVQNIYFTPGAEVNKGDVLVQLNADNDIALLHSLEAQAELANTTYLRDKAQFSAQAVSKQLVDNDASSLKSLKAQVAQQAAIVAKKTITAPFTGRLGINLINPGQYINPGDSIVMLQTLDPIYADFYAPQQVLAKVKVGMAVNITLDVFPGQKFPGKITTINPGVDDATRNVEVEATIANPKKELAPGMFVTVDVTTGQDQKYLTVPQSVVTFNPYGELVYVVKKTDTDWKGKSKFIASQSFVKTGDTRGDEVAILSGLKEGDVVVTSGQLKLKNNAEVSIDNSGKEQKLSPVLNNDH